MEPGVLGRHLAISGSEVVKMKTSVAQRLSGLAIALAAALLGVVAVRALVGQSETKPGRAEFQAVHGQRPEATPTPPIPQSKSGISASRLAETEPGRASVEILGKLQSAAAGEVSALAARIRWAAIPCRTNPPRDGILPTCEAAGAADGSDVQVIDMSPGLFVHFATQAQFEQMLALLLRGNTARVVLLGQTSRWFTMGVGFEPRTLPPEFFLGNGAYGYLAIDFNSQGEILRISPNTNALKNWREVNDSDSSGLLFVEEQLVEAEAAGEAKRYPTPVKPK